MVPSIRSARAQPRTVAVRQPTDLATAAGSSPARTRRAAPALSAIVYGGCHPRGSSPSIQRRIDSREASPLSLANLASGRPDSRYRAIIASLSSFEYMADSNPDAREGVQLFVRTPFAANRRVIRLATAPRRLTCNVSPQAECRFCSGV